MTCQSWVFPPLRDSGSRGHVVCVLWATARLAGTASEVRSGLGLPDDRWPERGPQVPYSSVRGGSLDGTWMTEALHVYEGIITTFQVVSDRVREALAAFKITPAQFGVLRRLGNDEVVSLTELAHRLGCTNANVTRLIENMVKAGLVEKLQHPSDQRIAPIRLTARGAEVRDDAGAAYSRAVGAFVSQLGEEERSALLTLRSRLG